MDEILQPRGKVSNDNSQKAARIFPLLSLQAEKRAHHIVMKCVEANLNRDELAILLKYVKPEHFDDICRERALAGICGYPLCMENHTDNFGKNDLIIRNNKVYNIEKRRDFCSNQCYEAYTIVLKQIPLTPLYLRDEDLLKEHCNLYLPFSNTLKGLYGDTVNITGNIEDEESNEYKSTKIKNKKETVDNIALESLVMCTENASNSGTKTKTPTKKTKTNPEKETKSNNTNKHDRKSTKSESPKNPKSTKSEHHKNPKNINPDKLADDFSQMKLSSENLKETNIPYEHRELPDSDSMDAKEQYRVDVMNKIDEMMKGDQGEKKQRNQFSDSALVKEGEENLQNSKAISLEPIYQIERVLREWMTFESLREILGDRFVRGMLESLNENWEKYNLGIDVNLKSNARLKYVMICKKIDQEEKEEKRLDENEIREESTKEEDMENMSNYDYDKMKKEVDIQTQKMAAFLGGSTEYVVDDKMEEEGDIKMSKYKNKQMQILERDVSSINNTNSTSIPIIDEYSQRICRQEIVMEKIDNVLGDLTLLLNLWEKEVRRLILNLVFTFELTRDNISFKPAQWLIVTLVMIKLLSVRYPIINAALQEESAKTYISSIFKGIGLDINYLDRLLSYLTEIQYIIEKSKISTSTCEDNNLDKQTDSCEDDNLEKQANSSQEIYSTLESLD